MVGGVVKGLETDELELDRLVLEHLTRPSGISILSDCIIVGAIAGSVS